jgi:ATP-dependent Clp protease ATP-binding subunit ClpB
VVMWCHHAYQVIMTSNLGAAQLLADVQQHGTVTEAGEAAVMEHVKRAFAPEFLNRLDDLIVFSPLNMDALHSILEAHLYEAAKRPGLADRNGAHVY